MGGNGETITYRELDERSARLAQLLHARGLRPGDRIALLAENHPRCFEVFWAAMRSGLYFTAVNRHLSVEEAAYIVDDSEASVLIATAALANTAVAMADLTPNCSMRLMIDGVADGFESYEAAISGQPALPLADQPRGNVMLYSSGTTGRPKGVKLPLSGLQVDDPEVAGAATLEQRLLGMDGSSIYLCPAPLYHSAGIQWSAGVHELGGTVVVMERFQEEEWLRLIERERVTHTQVVPTMLVRVMKLPDEYASVRPVELAVRLARGCTVPDRAQAPGHRLAGPDRERVLCRHRRQRDDVHRCRGMAGASRLGGATCPGHAAHLRRRRQRAADR
jgi:acyl-CoA synthetase (AMP-forming)/AMP-acid ligase II